MERKLAAIMAIDVVGFAGRLSRDEADTLARIAVLRRDVIDMQVGACRGRVFKAMGDGFLAEFSSTLEAARCALNIQRAMALEARAGEGADPLQLRIGIALGDVLMEGEDLLGEGVNAAARLEAMAEPGGIAVSDAVMAQIRGKLDIPLEDGGHRRLKATDAPMHVYLTRAAPGASGGFFDFDEDLLNRSTITGSCLCGEVRFEITAPPISSGYCHCRICQRFSGSAFSTWAAFPAAAVTFPGKAPRYHASSPIAERGFCATCGASLTYRLLRPKEAAYLVIFTPALEEAAQQAPGTHSGVESQMPWIDILDDLPRTRTAESRVLQEAWASVGLPDPGSWGPGARPPDPF